MTPRIHPAATAAPSRLVFCALIEAINALRGLAQTIDGWVEARRRAAADRDVLANMSDRELLDIGIVRASVDAVADGTWARDYLH